MKFLYSTFVLFLLCGCGHKQSSAQRQLEESSANTEVTTGIYESETKAPNSFPNSSNNPQNMINEQLISIAKKQIIQERPEWVAKLKRQPQISDKGHYWEIVFLLPQPKDGTFILGGSPIVWIDKETMKVIRLYHTQ